MSRYIDADEIVYFNDTEEDRPIVRALVAYKGQIDRIPSADVAPVVHGHWIQLSADDQSCNEFVCSVCGHEIFHIGEPATGWKLDFSTCDPAFRVEVIPTDFVEVELLPKYCEECGAKMDESKEENHNMTKEEAIKQLIDLKDDRQSFLGGVDDEIYLADIEAIDFAVKHLQNDCRSDSGLPDTQKRL